ncbi:MAG: hypothetical protein LKJ76_02080 [Lachnospiraceae bacterium]|jgi:hypothetical protein|nr:hypothetical protein [Lachnospiraceae bacterium]
MQVKTSFRSWIWSTVGALAAALLIAAVPALPVCARDVGIAAPGEGFVQADYGVEWALPDGTFLKNDWLHYMGRTYYLNEQGYIQVGLVRVGDKIYYLTSEGVVKTGWQQIGSDVFYFGQDGTMAVNTTIDGKQIGADGRYTGADAAALAAGTGTPAAPAQTAGTQTASDPTRQQVLNIANSVIGSVTNSSMTQKQKLNAVYSWLIRNASYRRTYETPSGDWTADFALQMLSSHKGNCFRFAASFAYLAKALGYNVKVITGQVSAARGGVTPHSWDEVYIDGGWYIFDSELQFANHYNMFERTYSNYPIKPLIKQREWGIEY